MTSRRGLAATQWKLPIAGIAAAGCLGILVWRLIPSRSERTDLPKPQIVRADGRAPEPRPRRRADGPAATETSPQDDGRSYSFVGVSNPAGVSRQMESMARAVTDAPEGSASLAEGVRKLLEPLNAGSKKEALADAIQALGGTALPDESGRSPVDGFHALFGGLLRFASLDTANIEVRRPTVKIPADDGLRIGMNRNISTDPETGKETRTLTHTVTGSPGRLFPDAAGEGAKGRLVELRLPFLANGGRSDTPDIVVLMHMREVAAGRWQPAGFVVDVRNEKLMQGVTKELTATRPPPGGG